MAKTEITLQSALDEAHTTELSNLSTAEIQRANSPTLAKKPSTIHHKDVEQEDKTEDTDDIHHLKTTSDRCGASDRAKPQNVCLGCGRNHPWSV